MNEEKINMILQEIENDKLKTEICFDSLKKIGIKENEKLLIELIKIVLDKYQLKLKELLKNE